MNCRHAVRARTESSKRSTGILPSGDQRRRVHGGSHDATIMPMRKNVCLLISFAVREKKEHAFRPGPQGPVKSHTENVEYAMMGYINVAQKRPSALVPNVPVVHPVRLEDLRAQCLEVRQHELLVVSAI